MAAIISTTVSVSSTMATATVVDELGNIGVGTKHSAGFGMGQVTDSDKQIAISRALKNVRKKREKEK